MKNILLPTDFSEAANAAFVQALNIARNDCANLHILHVCPKVEQNMRIEFVLQFSENTDFERFGTLKDKIYGLYKIAWQHGFQNLFFSIHFRSGTLISQISEKIKNRNIDFLIMGTNGLTSIHKKIFGSNTIRVLNKFDVPILIVPASAVYKTATEVGYTTIFKLSGMGVLRGVLDYSEKHNTRLNCLHITDGEVNDPALLETINYWEGVFNSKHLRFLIKKRNGQKKYEIIQKFIEEYNIDYLCMMKQNLPFFKRLLEPSLSEKLARSLKIPLFVVKED